ncbi:MAG: NAD-dependent epimerase/dehydratase [Candidatus Saganbacteria bacterium]|uniref:NAD-dependent epimerase/dehydratase n=1 Tax=Candidatus Saganbacteria bacterium TaxID=2575572 RepID=A0A833KZU5_UNCSA|nr:MAG: NAD-dependent epimerase/dehydratase [Candidatus Saganbacteria bacterium]
MHQKYKGKNILITGGLGFIGSTLAYRLVDFGSNITVVDSLFPDYGGNKFNINGIDGKVKVIIADVRDEQKMNEFVKDKDIIFNLAGTLSHVDSMKDPYTDLEINCRAQLSILESCRKFNPKVKILFAGTRGQYGRAQYLPVDENHPQCPTDVNGINNMAGEWYHILYNNVYGIKACSLRLTNTYGPRHQMKHSRQGVVNWFIRQIIDGEEIIIYGDGKQIRDLNYVDDVVEAFLLAAESEKANGQIFNIGGNPISLKDLIGLLIKVKGRGSYKLIPFPPDSKKIEIGDYAADYSKIKSMLGWSPKVSLEEGIKKTFEYYDKNKKEYWQ